ERIKEVNLSDKVGAMNVDVIEVANTGYQTYPDRPKMLAMGLAFGSMLGFGLGWLRDFLDHRMKSIEEIASVMQLPIVGAIPLIVSARSGTKSTSGQMVALQPRSTGAESVRTLRTALHFGIASPNSKTFVVTSPAPGDGKSTVASNLAIAMAQSNQRVLLIDADMRKPTLHEIFEVDSKVGLTSVLSGGISAMEAIVPTSVSSLDLLPCGSSPSSPFELLNNGLFFEALSQLIDQYDRIIIDSPPVMAVADARLLSANVDCTLMVLRAERSIRRLSVAARDELLNVGTQRLGIVVNAAPAGRLGYGYGAYGQSAYGYSEDEPKGVSKNGRAPSQQVLVGTPSDQ
ncbi:MAG: polysaccharide biosynthesis tyrosine autokinase, partial [Planctomycetota bacterium]